MEVCKQYGQNRAAERTYSKHCYDTKRVGIRRIIFNEPPNRIKLIPKITAQK